MLKKLLYAFVILFVVFGTNLVSLHAAELTPEQASKALSDQQAKLGQLYSTGDNSVLCVDILNGWPKEGVGRVPRVDGSLFKWTNVFNTAYWIPVVPESCVKCIGSASECPFGINQNVPLSLNLIPLVIVRLYGLIASISIYALGLVFVIIGIRYMIGGLSKGGRYTDTAKNLRDVFSALIITMIVGTLFLQILYNVLSLNSSLDIKAACIPTNNASLQGTGTYCKK